MLDLQPHFPHTSIVHPGSDDHLRIHKCIHEGLLFPSLKKQQNGKVSLNNVILGIDYKLTIHMLKKLLCIAVQYFYMTNLLTLEKISRTIYTPTKTTKNNCLIKTIYGKLIVINKLELKEMNSTTSIVSKQVRL